MASVEQPTVVKSLEWVIGQALMLGYSNTRPLSVNIVADKGDRFRVQFQGYTTLEHFKSASSESFTRAERHQLWRAMKHVVRTFEPGWAIGRLSRSQTA